MKFDASFTSVGINLTTGLSSMMIKNTQQRKSYWIHLIVTSKNWLEQVNGSTLVTRLATNQRFSDDINVDATIKGGDWKMLFESIVLISIIDIVTTIGEHYFLEH